jgi:hypothetical protein
MQGSPADILVEMEEPEGEQKNQEPENRITRERYETGRQGMGMGATGFLSDCGLKPAARGS